MQNDSNLNNSKEIIVAFNHVDKIYTDTKETALRDVTFTVTKGEFLCLVGPSGEGKSTVLKIIAGLEKETAGTVTRPDKVSMAFQTVALFPWLTVYENVALGLRELHMSDETIKKTVHTYIEMMKMSEFVDRRPIELSGGQRQRVGIARALAVNPEVLLLDEPFSALDPKTTAELHDDIISIWKKTGKTIIMVSHLIEEAVSLAEEVMLIKKNKLEHTFTIDLPYPRREQETQFMQEVTKVRKEFFK